MKMGDGVMLDAGTLIFLIWAAALFRATLPAGRIAAGQCGYGSPGPISARAAWQHWLSDPERKWAKAFFFTPTFLIIPWALGLALPGPTLNGAAPK